MDAETFSALAEPNRIRIVELLRDSPSSVNEVAQKLELRQPQASKHLHTLHKAGLVTVSSFAQKRIYTLSPEPFLRLDDWVSSFEHFWAQRLSSLEKHLEQIKER